MYKNVQKFFKKTKLLKPFPALDNYGRRGHEQII